MSFRPLHFRTALGFCSLTWSGEGITSLRFLGEAPLPREESAAAPVWIFQAVRAVTRHLAGEAQDLARIPLDLSGLPSFQRKVAEVLRASRPGETLTYGEVALLAGSPGAARAVGRAVKANPILLLVPCHRVVAADGPGGWSAFGSPGIKQRLLELESPHT